MIFDSSLASALLENVEDNSFRRAALSGIPFSSCKQYVGSGVLVGKGFGELG